MELSTSDFELQRDSVELIFEQGHQLNRGKNLKILIDGNDFPERTENIDERADRIAKKLKDILYPLSDHPDGSKLGFVYITLSAGGLGKFRF